MADTDQPTNKPSLQNRDNLKQRPLGPGDPTVAEGQGEDKNRDGVVPADPGAAQFSKEQAEVRKDEAKSDKSEE